MAYTYHTHTIQTFPTTKGMGYQSYKIRNEFYVCLKSQALARRLSGMIILNHLLMVHSEEGCLEIRKREDRSVE